MKPNELKALKIRADVEKKFKAGDTIISLVTLRNGYCEIKPGTRGVLIRHWRGWHIDFMPCPHCGIKVSFSRVRELEFKKESV